METRMLLESEIEAASVTVKTIFDMVVRNYITNPQTAQMVENYISYQNLSLMHKEGSLYLWGTFEAGQIIAVSAMQREGHITLLYVLPYYQKMGIGSMLLHQMTEYSTKALKNKRLTVNAIPVYSSGYFAKRGFQKMPGGHTNSFISMVYSNGADGINSNKRHIRGKTLAIFLPASFTFILLIAIGIVHATM